MPRHDATGPSFTETAQQHLDGVYRYLMQMARDPHLADDLTSETFERAFRQWSSYDPRQGPPLPWLLTIARRIALDHFRSEKRRRGREDRYNAMTPLVTEDRPSPDGAIPPEMAEAMETLSDVEREIVALRVLLDVDGATTADLVGVSPSACSTHLHRAMTKLRKALTRD